LNFARTLFSCGFTLPDSINSLAIHQNSLHTLFEATLETLQQFSKTKEIQAGMIAVLHLGTAIEFASTCIALFLVAELTKRQQW
jgi:hypothetical protein